MAPVDPTISKVVNSLRGWHGLRVMDLAVPLSTSKATVERRLSEGGWTAAEVAALAAYFERPVGEFYTGNVQVAESRIHDDVRLSREPNTAGQGPFSGSDIDRLIEAAEAITHAA